jgi:hypothetical protein
MNSTICQIVRWAARATALFIAASFFAFAVGEPAGSLGAIHPREWVGMILLLGAVVAMLLAWKWEFPAALISLIALGAFAAVVRIHRFDVLVVAAIPNLLYLLDWKLRGHYAPPISKAG